MPLVRFEPTTSAGERLQTYALDRAVTVTSSIIGLQCIIVFDTGEEVFWNLLCHNQLISPYNSNNEFIMF
jgi:hypothetical protein